MSDDRLIVALDVPDFEKAKNLVAELGDSVSFYKVGLGMLPRGGLNLARELKDEGKRVFLDLKLFDIGATVRTAVDGLARLEMDFLTVHGDPYVVRAAIEGRAESQTKILAITILTSVDRSDLDAALIRSGDIQSLVVERAKRAFDAGADGIVASPNEAKVLRTVASDPSRLIVTPGIRPAGAGHGDQKRVASPKFALSNGANHIVVGRPIWQSENPRKAVEEILSEFPLV